MNFEDKLIITLLDEGRLKKAVKKTGSWLNKKLGIVASPEESRKMAHLDRVLDYREGGASEEEAQSLAKKDQDEIDNLKQNEAKKIPARGATPPKTINVDYVNITRQNKVKAAEDKARAKVLKRTEGQGLSPTQVGRRMGRAVHWAGSEYIRRGTDVNEADETRRSPFLPSEHYRNRDRANKSMSHNNPGHEKRMKGHRARVVAKEKLDIKMGRDANEGRTTERSFQDKLISVLLSEMKNTDKRGMAYAAGAGQDSEWGPPTAFGDTATRSSMSHGAAGARSIIKHRSQTGQRLKPNRRQRAHLQFLVHKGWSKAAQTSPDQTPEQKTRRAKLIKPTEKRFKKELPKSERDKDNPFRDLAIDTVTAHETKLKARKEKQ
jgi:hypothetical protein